MAADVRGPGSALGGGALGGGALSVADRSRVISESLRQMARVSRFSDAKGVTRAPYAARRGRRRDLVTPILFVLLFLLPALIGIAYFGVIASDRFVTEASFALRPALEGSEKAAPDAVGTTLGVPKAMIVQDTLIVTEYILSRPMLEALEPRLPLRSLFARSDIDYPSRLNPDKPVEKILKYWANRVGVSVSPSSGIVSLTVNAFTAQESLALTRAILTESERMINALSLRARRDALEESRRVLDRAEARIAAVRTAMRDLRNKEGVLDAQRSADATFKMISDLKGSRIQLATRQSLLGRDLAPEARAMLELTIQMQQIDETIRRLERSTTAQTPQERRVLSETLSSFDALDVERRNAERYYAQAVAAHERARIIADRQIEFFSPVVEPVLAASAQAPRRVLSIVLVLASAACAFLLALFGRRLIGA